MKWNEKKNESLNVEGNVNVNGDVNVSVSVNVSVIEVEIVIKIGIRSEGDWILVIELVYCLVNFLRGRGVWFIFLMRKVMVVRGNVNVNVNVIGIS